MSEKLTDEMAAEYVNNLSTDDQPNEVGDDQDRDVIAPAANRLQKAMKGVNAFAYTTLDAGTMGLIRPIGAEFTHTMQQANPATAGLKSREEIHADTQKFFEENRDRLPFSFQLGAEVLGAYKGVPGVIDDVLLGKVGGRLSPDKWDKARRFLTGAAATAPSAAFDRYMRDDMELGDALQAGAFDALFGIGVGQVLGEVVTPAMSRAVRKVKGPGPYGSLIRGNSTGIADKAIANEGGAISMQDLLDTADLVAKGGAETKGKTLLELPVGKSTKGDRSIRFHDTMADLYFKDMDVRKLNTAAGKKAIAQYNEVTDLLRKSATQANADAANALDNVLHRSIITPTATDEVEAAKRLFASLGNDGSRLAPGEAPPLGATDVNAREIVKSAQDFFETAQNKKLSNMATSEQKVWNKFTDLLRLDVQEEWAKGVRSQAVDPRKMSVNELMDIFPSEMKLAKLYSVRKEMADLITPSGRLDANPLSKTQRRAVMKMLNFIDDTISSSIDTHVGSEAFGEARANFAKAMKRQELETLGNKFYSQRRQVVEGPDAKQLSPEHYGETIEDFWKGLSEEEQAHFRKGWVDGMVDRTSKRRPLTELSHFYGNLDDNNVLTATSGKDHMEMVLGEDRAKRIEEVYTKFNRDITESNALKQLFEDQLRGDPEAAFRDIKRRPTDIDNPGDMFMSVAAMLKRAVKTKDKNKVEALMKLMTASDEELSNLLRKAVKEAAPGSPGSFMVRSTLASTAYDRATDDQERQEQEEPYDAITEYLKSVEGEED